ncbi:hypothetical protein TCON_1238 [Astathelohania contejeani]|uniref:FHA domain-containing protein n=1 Tax=Astathelohania contejeani TaxID=164912 RepID=A0ABQ7HZK5_9MICR|nr:hypothetical protein TCON_1238 [Thelohania contejeani]
MQRDYKIKLLDDDNKVVNELKGSKEGITIGRDLLCDIRIQLPSVKEKHAFVDVKEKNVHAYGNDVFVNEEYVQENTSKNFHIGDIIKVKGRKFMVSMEPETVTSKKESIPSLQKEKSQTSPKKKTPQVSPKKSSARTSPKKVASGIETRGVDLKTTEGAIKGETLGIGQESLELHDKHLEVQVNPNTEPANESEIKETLPVVVSDEVKGKENLEKLKQESSKRQEPIINDNVATPESLLPSDVNSDTMMNSSAFNELINPVLPPLSTTNEEIQERIIERTETIEEEIRETVEITGTALDIPITKSILNQPKRDLRESILEKNLLKTASEIIQSQKEEEESIVDDIKKDIMDNIKEELIDEVEGEVMERVETDVKDVVKNVMQDNTVTETIVNNAVEAIKAEEKVVSTPSKRGRKRKAALETTDDTTGEPETTKKKNPRKSEPPVAATSTPRRRRAASTSTPKPTAKKVNKK